MWINLNSHRVIFLSSFLINFDQDSLEYVIEDVDVLFEVF